MTCRLQETPKTVDGKDAGRPRCRALGLECQFQDDPGKCPMAAALDRETSPDR